MTKKSKTYFSSNRCIYYSEKNTQNRLAFVDKKNTNIN